MTSGSIPWGTTLNDKTGTRLMRVWSGGDGRTEAYAGGVRAKWNNYTLDFRARTRLEKEYSYKRKPINGGNVVTATAVVGDPSFPAVPWTANDDLKLQAKLLEQIKGHSFNLAVDAAQGRQLVNMLSDNLRKIGRAGLALKRGDFATAARQLGAKPKTTRLDVSDLSGRWLELQYGWKPALSSCYEASKAFEAISNGPRSATVRVGRQIKGVRTITSNIIVQYDAKDTYRKSIQYEMYEEMSAPRQLGLVDPASVAWELMPFSFVADWFIPIGSYLSNLNQIPKLRGRFLTTVYRKSEHYLGFRTPMPYSPVIETVYYIPKNDRGRSISVVRTVSSSLSVPFPSFKVGRKTVSHENGRLQNAIALTQQIFNLNVGRKVGTVWY
jgi:hypothetical protein